MVEHTRRAPRPLDLKNGGVIPIVNLARWAGMTAGVTSASTIERLRAADAAGTLSEEDLHTLEDAFELVSALRSPTRSSRSEPARSPTTTSTPRRSAR